ncbi:hypothetical protein M405DRAFT_861060 [Rhizopogon salebrosus TDB-379]|nr:hypothetical protein M405DRAFT_861060 [Rhizopogon salebrosus TDB-379]
MCGDYTPPKELVVIIMGINDLWQVLEPAATTTPIVSLALKDRYMGPAPHFPYVVGIDARSVFAL